MCIMYYLVYHKEWKLRHIPASRVRRMQMCLKSSQDSIGRNDATDLSQLTFTTLHGYKQNILMSAPVTSSFFYRLPNWWTNLISHTETTRNWEVFWSIYVTCNEARVHYFPAWSKTNPRKWNTNILPGSSVPEKATRVPSSRKAVAAAFLEILTVCWSPTNGTTQ